MSNLLKFFYLLPILILSNPENLRKAKGTLTWSLVGLLLSMVIFGILILVVNFLF